MLRTAALVAALTVLAPGAARALAIIEIDLVTGYPLSDLGIERSAVAPAQITPMEDRDVLVLPIASGGAAPGVGFSFSFVGGLQLAREGAAATITEIEMMGTGISPEERTIAGTARLALDGVDQGVIQLNLDFCDEGPSVSDACLDDDGSSILTGVRVALTDADALAVFQHLGVENIVLSQIGIWDGQIRLPEPSPALLLAGAAAALVSLRRSASRRPAG